MIRTTARLIWSEAADWPIARPSEKLCSPMPVAMKIASQRAGDIPAKWCVVLELGGRGRAGAEEGAAAAAFHPDVVVDEAHQPDEKPAVSRNASQAKRPSWPSSRAVSTGSTAPRHDVPEEEDQDAGRGRGEERLRRGGDVLHAADRQAEEDREAGDGAEHESLQRCSCKGAPYRLRSRSAMAQGHSVDEYLETIYFLAFPIGEYRPLGRRVADAGLAGRRDARRLAGVGRARC